MKDSCKTGTAKAIYKYICDSDVPVRGMDINQIWGAHKAYNALCHLVKRTGKLKKRKVLRVGMTYWPVEREWPVLEPAVVREAERKAARAKAKFKPDSSCGVAGGSAHAENFEGYPFFSEKFAPYLEFFPPKTKRRYEKTLELRKQKELEAANQQRFGQVAS